MKTLVAPSTTLIVSPPRFLPPSYYHHRAYRPFTLKFDVAGTGPYWPHLGVDLSGDVEVDYLYQKFHDFLQCQHECDILNNAAVGSLSGLYGGELFNYVVRAQCSSKIVFG
jgi:hypothetical protein